MKNRSAVSGVFKTIVAVTATGAVVLPVIIFGTNWPHVTRDYLETMGFLQTGALNLVSAIYLGYRAFDTLGETIVLLVAVSGTIELLNKTGSSFILPDEKRKSHVLRTNLLETVTGKIGPVILLFGFYVMLYGHLSPGGGFQGGVILASGIVFIALGSMNEISITLTRTSVLRKMEAAAFMLLLAAAASAMCTGKSFFENPLADTGTSQVLFIIILNAIIGLKVGAGIGLLCIVMLGKEA